MNETLISVIIPVFNGAAHIRECLGSVLDSTWQTLEIIVVDDGSTDDTAAICRELAADGRIRLLHQEHRGVSAARNLGLRHASGKYLTFVDGDDLLDRDILSRAAARMEAEGLVCWNISCRYGDRVIPEPEFSLEGTEKAVLCAAAIGTVPAGRRGRYFRACWGKLFDAALIRDHNLAFDEALSIGEDAVFLLQYLLLAEKVRFLPDYGYYYRKQPDSSARRFRENLLPQLQKQKDRIESITAVHGLGEDPAIRTALVAMYWDMFEKLLRNREAGGTSYGEAKAWLEAVKPALYGKGVACSQLPRLCRLGRYLPPDILCALTSTFRKLRRHREWRQDNG